MFGKNSAYVRLKKFRELKRRIVEDDGNSSDINSEISVCSVNAISASRSPIEDVDHKLKIAKFFDETELRDLYSNSYLHDLESETSLLSDTGRDDQSEIEEERAKNEHLIRQSFENLSLLEKLVKWASENLRYLLHTVIDELLKLLRSEGHYNLPRTAETLLKTKKTEGAITEMLCLLVDRIFDVEK